MNYGYAMSLYSTEGNSDVEKRVITRIISNNMGGIIAIDPSIENLDNGYFHEISKKIPMIIINANTDRDDCNFISYDEEIGTKDAFQYLLNLGHTKISFIRGDRSLSYDLKERIYKDFLIDKKLEFENIVNVGKGNSIEVIENTENICEKLLKNQELGTAVFACNDLMAVGVVNACTKLNLRVPQHISVVGFDNTLLSSINHPRITTVDLQMKTIGNDSAMCIIEMIKRKTTKIEKRVYQTKLIVRDSCLKTK